MYFQPTGIKAIPLSLNWDVVPARSDTTIKVGTVEVGNGTAADIEAGWGTETYNKVGKWDDSLASSFYIPDTLYPITMDLIASNDGILILTPTPCDAIEFEVSTLSADPVVIEVWDGSAFQTVSGGVIREDFSATGLRKNVFPGKVNAGVVENDALENVPNGWYAIRVSGGDAAVIDAIRTGTVLDRVLAVAPSDNLLFSYDSKDKLCLVRNYGLFMYVSDADAANFANVKFGAV